VRRAPLLLLVLALAACGGSKSPAKDAGPPRPTQKQFVSAANAVCVRSDRAIYNLGALTIDPAGWAATATAARAALADMRKLTPPAGKDAAFHTLLAQGTKLADAIQRVHDALVRKDLPAARTAQGAASKADVAVHKQAQKLGLTFCQQALTNWPA
jgi:hypothetical protein